VGTAIALMIAAVCGAAPASAGIVNGGFSEDPPRPGCFNADCGGYGIQAPSTSAPVRITPNDGRDRSTNEAAYADFVPPFWPHTPVQGYQVHVELGGSVLGQNWEAVICRPGNSSSGLCDGGVQVFRGAGQTTLVMVLPTPEQRVRVALKYIGAGGRPNSAAIALSGRLSWYGSIPSRPRSPRSPATGHSPGR